MRYALEQMRGIPPEQRDATFQTIAALVKPDGDIALFAGSVHGRILEAPHGICQPSMPYSPIFLPEGQTKTFAEMTTEEENVISHRGKAFRFLREYLERVLSQQ